MADDRERNPNPDESVDEIGHASNENVTDPDDGEFEDTVDEEKEETEDIAGSE